MSLMLPPLSLASFAAALRLCGVEVNVIRGWLGHVSLETTNRYGKSPCG